MRAMRRVLLSVIVGGIVAACGTASSEEAESSPVGTLPAPSADSPDRGSTPSSSGAPPSSDASAAGDAGATNADAAGDASGLPASIAAASCASPIPAGRSAAPALPTYAGACPAFAAAPASTTITSSGNARRFIVFRPQAIAPGEKLPVVFLWHWLGGSAEAMGTTLDVQVAVDKRRFIGVVPVPKGDALFRWPFEASQPQGRVDEEARFFDDMLACIGAALPVNKECVASAGVSAGALWTAQLAVARSERLSSIVSLSGGTGGFVRPWSTTAHRLPALVLWGGSSDTYPSNVPIMNFEKASKDLGGALSAGGHFLVECTHNCGHSVPPFDAPPPGSGGLLFDPLWRFVLDHPYWLAALESPYTGKPLPSFYPSWCGQQLGSATPRPAGAACP